MDPPDHTPRAGAAHAADHAEAAEGQRGVHVAPRRPAARRVRSPTAAASSSAPTPSPSPCSSSPTCSACPRRTTSASARASASPGTPGAVGAGDSTAARSATRSAWLDEWFAAYIEDRRREPRKDVLTDLALATYPDGTHARRRPSVVRTATFLFAAGQETTARLLAAALKHLAEHPELQDELRADQRPHPELPRGGAPAREPGEDRLPARPPHDHRRRRRDRGRHAGDAPQRRRQPRPPPLRVPRTSSASTGPTPRRTSPSAAGVHSCPGGPLARAEGRISLERILDRTRDIRLSEEHHGPRRRPPVPLRADVDPPRAHRAAPRVRPRRRRLSVRLERYTVVATATNRWNPGVATTPSGIAAGPTSGRGSAW